MSAPRLKWLAVAVWLLPAALAAGGHARGRSLGKEGESLFTGQRPLIGRIRGHQSSLPPEVVVCAHCHVQSAPDAGPPAAPTLNRALLLEQRQRRGGPPSAYDAASFCKLLRTGVDPAYVLVDRVMPMYQVSDVACSSLWQFLAE